MGNIVIATPDLSDVSAITGGATASSMPLSNLQDMQPSLPCMFTNLADVYFVVDLGAAQSINLVWLGYTNATATDTWRIRAASSEANLTSSPLYDSGSLDIWTSSTDRDTWDRIHALHWMDSPVSARYWRIDVSSTSPDSVFTIGRLYLSNAYQPSRNVRYGLTTGTVEQIRRTESLLGNVFPRPSAKRQAMDFALEHLTRDEMLGSLYRIQRSRGVSSDVLVILDPDETEYLMELTCYGLFKDLSRIEIPTVNVYKTSLSLEEMP